MKILKLLISITFALLSCETEKIEPTASYHDQTILDLTVLKTDFNQEVSLDKIYEMYLITSNEKYYNMYSKMFDEQYSDSETKPLKKSKR